MVPAHCVGQHCDSLESQSNSSCIYGLRDTSTHSLAVAFSRWALEALQSVIRPWQVLPTSFTDDRATYLRAVTPSIATPTFQTSHQDAQHPATSQKTSIQRSPGPLPRLPVSTQLCTSAPTTNTTQHTTCTRECNTYSTVSGRVAHFCMTPSTKTYMSSLPMVGSLDVSHICIVSAHRLG